MVRLDLNMGAKFSDDFDCVCKKCGELESACVCAKGGELKERESYFLGINEQKASGKDVTHCGIFFETKQTMQVILKEAKKKFSCGGSLEQDNRGFSLILQGKHKDALKMLLKAHKFQFKK
ncbi:translation initiation factor [Helicobacter sp.]|uniref:translation initiation factor n=1 Tax=Helicobacter sp. TaxID=218 RepID=UPI0025C6BB5E|nr:translation initiation factor [Helicobacter sp.]MCI5968030.1 translation initiation factor [Helicobacter sp.]MDY2585141.1 translation initiation factor [Helicobacter sp.]